MNERRIPGRQLLLTVAVVGLTGCISPFHDQQSARIVAPGETEITVAYSQPMLFEDGEREKIHDDVGVQFAAGVGENAEIRARYEYLSYGDDGGYHVLGVGPKFALAEDKLALYLPVGAAFGNEIETSETLSFHPTLILSHRASPQVELNLSGKGIIYADEPSESDIAFNIGLGLSSDPDRWVFRPEVGVLFDTEEWDRIWQVAFGISLNPGGSE